MTSGQRSNQQAVRDKLNNLKQQNQQSSGGSRSLKTPAFMQLKKELHQQLLNEIPPEDLANENNSTTIKDQIVQIVNMISVSRGIPLSAEQKVTLINDLTDEVLGFGPLEILLRDKSISEIMINGHKTIFIERAGKLVKLGDQIFDNEDHLLHIVKRIALKIGRRIDNASPTVDARLPDGSRVNAVIPPLALDGTTVTIRKFPDKALYLEDLVGFDALTTKMARFLALCVEGQLNTIVAGGTGSGKTTLLNALSGFIPGQERIITIEDSAELRLQQEHVVRLETRAANAEGVGEVTARDLIKNALRMRPNRIVVGECRGGEAIDMLQAMNTGHEGSMTTLHANTTRDMLKRLESLVLMSGVDLPLKTVREMISSTVHLVVMQGRLPDGSRRVRQISEIVGMEGETIATQDIYRFQQVGVKDGKVQGEFLPTGVLPRCVAHLKAYGFEVPMELFAPDSKKG